MVAGANCHFLFFDAVGTLLKPCPDVVTAYRQLGRIGGSNLSAEEIRRRFSQLYPLHFPHNSSARESSVREALRTSEQLERQRWLALVTDLFDDVPDPALLFSALWDHFSRPEHWELYPDARPLLEWLGTNQIAWGIASNFDRRLELIVSAIPELAAARLTFTSATAGWNKPAKEFYELAGKAAAEVLGTARLELWMIGDNQALDFQAARASGWHAIWLAREQPSLLDSGRINSLCDLRLLSARFT